MQWHDYLSLVLAAVGALWILDRRSFVSWQARICLARIRAKTLHRRGFADGWGAVGKVTYSAEGAHGKGPMYVVIDCPLEPPWTGIKATRFQSVRLMYFHNSQSPNLAFAFSAAHELVEKERIVEIRWLCPAPGSRFRQGTILPQESHEWLVPTRETGVSLGNQNSLDLLTAMSEMRSERIMFTIVGFLGQSFEAGTLSVSRLFSTPAQRYIDDWLRAAGQDREGLQSTDRFPPLRSQAMYGAGSAWAAFFTKWWIKWITSPTFRRHAKQMGWGWDRITRTDEGVFGMGETYWWEKTKVYAWISKRRMKRDIENAKGK